MLLRKEVTMSHVQIDKFKYHPQEYSIDELISILLAAVLRSLDKCSSPGLLLSGGQIHCQRPEDSGVFFQDSRQG